LHTRREDERISLLLVDDKQENLLALRSILDCPEYRLISASSGPEALRQVLHEDFAAIVLDVLMPGMDGFEVASTIKLRERSRRTPIIFLTAAGADLGLDGRGYEVGAVDYLTKPVSPSVLKAKVAVFADLFRKSREIARQAELLRQAELRERDRRLADIERQNEVRYQKLADAIPHIVWRADPNGALVYLNRRFAAYTGEGGARERSLDALAAIHPDDRAPFRRRWREARDETEALVEVELRLRGADGRYRWHLFRALPDRGDDGTARGWLGTFTDVENEKAAQAVLEVEHRRSSLIARASSLLDLSFDVDSTIRRAAALAIPAIGDGCVVDVLVDGNRLRRAAAHADSHLPDVVDAVTRSEAFAPEPDIDGVLRSHQPTLVQDGDAVQRHLCVDGKGTLNAIGACVVAPLTARGAVFGLITCFRDPGSPPYGAEAIALVGEFAARASLAIDNSRLYAEATEAIGARDEFLSIASHELKTPLTSLTLHVQSLLRKARTGTVPNEVVSTKLDVIMKQTDRLERLIDQLLDVSRAAAGVSEMSFEPTDLSAVARDVSARLSEDALAARAPITVTAEEVVKGRWDRLKLEQVLTNLLSNAIKYGRGKPVQVQVQSKADVAVLTVRDHGIGLAPEQHARIFERFERAVSAREFGGLGLGLYITRRLVEAHGGSIAVSSARGEGATFTVELPYDPTAALARTTVASARPPAAAS
jgi:PAS domain S-box-containing protein